MMWAGAITGGPAARVATKTNAPRKTVAKRRGAEAFPSHSERLERETGTLEILEFILTVLYSAIVRELRS